MDLISIAQSIPRDNFMNLVMVAANLLFSEPAHLATLTLSVVISIDHYKLVARLVLTTNIRVTQGHYNFVPGRPLQIGGRGGIPG